MSGVRGAHYGGQEGELFDLLRRVGEAKLDVEEGKTREADEKYEKYEGEKAKEAMGASLIARAMDHKRGTDGDSVRNRN